MSWLIFLKDIYYFLVTVYLDHFMSVSCFQEKEKKGGSDNNKL
jgi:hypothetical protein